MHHILPAIVKGLVGIVRLRRLRRGISDCGIFQDANCRARPSLPAAGKKCRSTRKEVSVSVNILSRPISGRGISTIYSNASALCSVPVTRLIDAPSEFEGVADASFFAGILADAVQILFGANE